MRCRGSVSVVFAGITTVALAWGQSLIPVGAEFQVNSYTTSYQYYPSVAADQDGDFVVVWESYGSSGQDTSGYGVLGRRFRSDGAPMGTEFQVNSYTTGYQLFSSVAVDASGNFVVVWHSGGSSGTDTSGFSIRGRQFLSDGDAIGVEFQVNTYTTNGQYGPTVAAGPAGGFVVAWRSEGSSETDTAGYSIQAQRFASNGNFLGSQFQVNSYTTDNQFYVSVAIDQGGNFVVVWESNGSSGMDTSLFSVRGRRFGSNGAALGSEFEVNSYTTDNQFFPSVAVGPSGDFVVVWHSDGSSETDNSYSSIQAQSFASDGTPVGTEFQVNSSTTNYQTRPSVVVESGGEFVVVWNSDSLNGTDTSYRGIQGQRFAPNGSPMATEFQVNSYTTGYQVFSSVAVDQEGDFVVVWNSDGSSETDTSYSSIQAQLLTSRTPTPTPVPAVPSVPVGTEYQVNTYTTDAQREASVAVAQNSGFFVVWASRGSGEPDTSSYSIQGQRYDSARAPVGIEFLINTYTTDFQSDPSIAADSAGNFVVVWQSYGSSETDSSSSSIQSQRFDSSGDPIDTEFQVNSYTLGDQRKPAVAVEPDGDFVVVWQSLYSNETDSSGYSIQGRRFGSNGTAVGEDFQVNTYTTNGQHDPAVVVDAAGDFIVTWQSGGSSETDDAFDSIHGQRFASNGAARGSEFQVNTFTTSFQRYPKVALLQEGDFVIVWHNDFPSGQDPSISSVVGQLYDSGGTPMGTEFLVNSYTTSSQSAPSVAAEADGGFVVVWRSAYGPTGTDTFGSIQGQRFASTVSRIGSPGNVGPPRIGMEFQINTYTTNDQFNPSVAVGSNGDSMVVWVSDGSGETDTSGLSVHGQRFALATPTPTSTPTATPTETATSTPTPTPTDVNAPPARSTGLWFLGLVLLAGWFSRIWRARRSA